MILYCLLPGKRFGLFTIFKWVRGGEGIGYGNRISVWWIEVWFMCWRLQIEDWRTDIQISQERFATAHIK